MARPMVSVLMSVYNGERYLRESVESILNQTFTDFEFLIIDDGSKDGSREVIRSYSDLRIRLVQNERNMGLTCSLNKGLKLARGEYIARQDSDDVSSHDRLEKQVYWLNRHPKVVLVSSNVQFIDSEGRYLGQSRRTGDPDLVAWYLLFYNHVAGHSVVMFRQKTVMDLGGYSESYHYAQDHELWLRLVEAGDIVVLPDILLQWRQHDENISFKDKRKQEEFSLHATKQRISKLVGEEVSLTEMEELRDFWLGQFWNGKKLGSVHIRLKQIYREFLGQREEHGESYSQLSFRLHRLIARQFFECSRMVNIRKRLFLQLKGSLYGVRWHTAVGLTYCFKEAILLPFRLSRALLRRVFSNAS